MTKYVHVARRPNFDKMKSPTLVEIGLTLDRTPDNSLEYRMVRDWVASELERRAGGIKDRDAFEEVLEDGHSWVEALVITFPALTYS